MDVEAVGRNPNLNLSVKRNLIFFISKTALWEEKYDWDSLYL